MKTIPWRKPDLSTTKRFNFTYALPGGAWLEGPQYRTSEGMKADRNWYSFDFIAEQLGQEWIDRQMRKQGWMTGCWIDCD